MSWFAVAHHFTTNIQSNPPCYLLVYLSYPIFSLNSNNNLTQQNAQENL